LKKLIKNAFEYPEKSGRLTEAIREAAGIRRLRPSKYVVAESHIDLTMIDRHLVNSILELDFEFDNFAKIQPEQYKHHFTLEMWIRSDNQARCRDLFQLVTSRSRSVSEVIQQHAQADGYVETELYNSEFNVALPFRKPLLEALGRFPFEPGTFGRFDLPASRAEALARGLPVQCHRVADVHVKMPSHLNHPDKDAIDSKEMWMLKRALEASGFYGIVSEGANQIFTAHFYNIHEANTAFAALVDFAKRDGGLTGVSREVCTRMWRKETRNGTDSFLAEVPPLHSKKFQLGLGAPTLELSGLSRQESETFATVSASRV
jgi:hypothetical protein